MDFDEKLQKAIQRGQRRGDARAEALRHAAMTEEEFKRLHSQFRLRLSERIEECIKRLPNHFPGFRYETMLGERANKVVVEAQLTTERWAKDMAAIGHVDPGDLYDDAGNLIPNSDIGFTGYTSGIGILVGKLPQSEHLRVQGSYGTPGGIEQSCLGDGVVMINGKEVLRIPPGKPPYQMHDFDVDISSFAGQFVMLEFWSDGNIGGVAPLMQWSDPRIVATKESTP